ncbi:uncharacterized protein BO80DRAFT_217185 [Aspergillus ibericus CBS 121593]|uniref:Uncharacterized protein n=1 Tax=Aspergillus ibericus CBS 121593 TaxID=1448316 RepID=A0A395GMS8_9EURO|nr:hypothetical protein BO80DRAFT_217185 [Aspergillus ibericus CBS 121593]RAK96684.1 hypothetical protein BO80DRAFT_217185 [Aspergillus ibericus CBS 121593]
MLRILTLYRVQYFPLRKCWPPPKVDIKYVMAEGQDSLAEWKSRSDSPTPCCRDWSPASRCLLFCPGAIVFPQVLCLFLQLRMHDSSVQPQVAARRNHGENPRIAGRAEKFSERASNS